VAAATEPMTDSPVAADRTEDGHHTSHGWRIVAALAVTQTIGYGTLYYSFAVLLQPMADSLHASTTVVTGALTAAILAGASIAIPVGRWLDRHGGRALMTVGSVLATALVVAWSRVDSAGQLYAVLVGIGLCTAMVLYDPALAVVVSWFDADRRPRAVLAVIVVAGFASTIFMPLTAVLLDHLGWRTALLVLAAVYGTVAVPLHALVVRRPPPTQATAHVARRTRAVVVRAALHDGRFWLLATAFVAHGAAMSAMTVHLVGFLIRQGHPATFAATVAGLLGLLSVTGRLVLTVAQRRQPLTVVVAAVFGVQAAAATALMMAGGSRAGATVTVIGFGLGFGVASLATPQFVAGRYGTAAYGTIAGVLTTPVTLAKATAPLAAAAALTATGSYSPVLIAIAAACLIAAFGVLARASTPSPIAAPPRPDADETEKRLLVYMSDRDSTSAT
jgi:MFS family permease